ncbi:hypothetical protein FJ366_04045 [Candidatus Dependentiae bacterium]|nr:hypothetical protein [Candidatus Dependentiae bacterium]
MNHIKSLLLIFLCAVQLNAAPTEVIIPITENSTVADLFTYVGTDGEKHISFPLSPHFFHKSIEIRNYFAMYGKYLTLGAFLRFIKRGHLLFSQNEDQTNFKIKFYSLIDAKKELQKIEDPKFLSKKFIKDKDIPSELSQIIDKTTLATLNETVILQNNHDILQNNHDIEFYKKEIQKNERVIISLLEKLPLNEQAIQIELSNILSTKSNSYLLSKIFFPFASKIKWAEDNPIIHTVEPNQYVLLALLSFICSSLSFLAGIINKWNRTSLTFITIAAYSLVVIISRLILDKTNPLFERIKFFSPEPDDGISVSFEVVAEKPVPQADTATERLTS